MAPKNNLICDWRGRLGEKESAANKVREPKKRKESERERERNQNEDVASNDLEDERRERVVGDEQKPDAVQTPWKSHVHETRKALIQSLARR